MADCVAKEVNKLDRRTIKAVETTGINLEGMLVYLSQQVMFILDQSPKETAYFPRIIGISRMDPMGPLLA
jgi:hypothetical protein